MDRVLAKVQMEDEAERVAHERTQVQDRLRRLGKAFVDGLVDDVGYERQKRALEERLSGLVLPAVDAAAEAGRLLEDLPRLWGQASESERRKLLLTMLDAVYVDAREERRVVAVKAKPAFKPLLEIATTRHGSGVVLITQAPPPDDDGAEERLCSWWRRGRVELPVQWTPQRTSYKRIPRFVPRHRGPHGRGHRWPADEVFSPCLSASAQAAPRLFCAHSPASGGQRVDERPLGR